MKLTIVNKARAKVDARWVKRFVEDLTHALEKRRVLKRANGKTANGRYELTIVFVSQSEMRRLNKNYRGKDYATDVLSFEGAPALDVESGEMRSLGELVLCSSVLRRQAREHHLTFEQELAYMIIHGVLHLLGYEHERGGRDAREMYSLQDALFRELVG